MSTIEIFTEIRSCEEELITLHEKYTHEIDVSKRIEHVNGMLYFAGRIKELYRMLQKRALSDLETKIGL